VTSAVGLYWHLRNWELITLSGREELPEPRAAYVQVPLVCFLAMAPLMGAVYAMFLPFIGFALVLAYLSRKLGAAIADSLTWSLQMFCSPWRPGEAHLTERKPPTRPPSTE